LQKRGRADNKKCAHRARVRPFGDKNEQSERKFFKIIFQNRNISFVGAIYIYYIKDIIGGKENGKNFWQKRSIIKIRKA
jgi:hypothetical protein